MGARASKSTAHAGASRPASADTIREPVIASAPPRIAGKAPAPTGPDGHAQPTGSSSGPETSASLEANSAPPRLNKPGRQPVPLGGAQQAEIHSPDRLRRPPTDKSVLAPEPAASALYPTGAEPPASGTTTAAHSEQSDSSLSPRAREPEPPKERRRSSIKVAPALGLSLGDGPEVRPHRQRHNSFVISDEASGNYEIFGGAKGSVILPPAAANARDENDSPGMTRLLAA